MKRRFKMYHIFKGKKVKGLSTPILVLMGFLKQALTMLYTSLALLRVILVI